MNSNYLSKISAKFAYQTFKILLNKMDFSISESYGIYYDTNLISENSLITYRDTEVYKISLILDKEHNISDNIKSKMYMCIYNELEHIKKNHMNVINKINLVEKDKNIQNIIRKEKLNKINNG